MAQAENLLEKCLLDIKVVIRNTDGELVMEGMVVGDYTHPNLLEYPLRREVTVEWHRWGNGRVIEGVRENRQAAGLKGLIET